MNVSFLFRCGLSAFFLVVLGRALVFGQTVATVPVGAVTLTFPANSTTTVSLQLEEFSAFSGALSSVSSSSVTVSGVSWASNAYADPTLPYGVRITSGNYAGVLFPITASTSNQLTLQTDGVDLTTVLSGSESFTILPLDTLGTLFGTTSVPFQTGASAASADVICIWSGIGWSAYFNNGTTWRKTGFGGNQNNAIISPDAGLFVIRRGNTDLSVVITGQLRPQIAMRFLKPNGLTFLSNPFPVNMNMLLTNFSSSNGWQSGASAAAADTVYVWSGVGWAGYFFNGTNWRKTGFGGSQDATVIPPGTPFFVLRRSSPAVKDSVVTFTTPYTL